MSMKASRRRVLAATCLAGVAAAVGGFAVWSDREGLLRAILHRHLGPFEMADEDFAGFVQALADARHVPSAWESDILRMAEQLPAESADRLFPDWVQTRRDKMERALLAEFMLATNIRRLPHGKQLAYHGLFNDRICANPYARFD